MSRRRDIRLPPHLNDRLAQRHPWVYRNLLPSNLRMPSGTWVRARCGGWSGYGLWDDQGPIALRIFSERQVPDPAWMRARVRAAWELRAPLRAAGVSAYRWLFGEGDGLPGLTVDLYGGWAVVQTYMGGVETLVEWLADALREIAPLQGILRREPRTENQEPRTDVGDDQRSSVPSLRSRAGSGRRPSVFWGEPPPHD